MCDLVQKVGATTSVVKRGEWADMMMTVMRHLSVGERAAWDRPIDRTYRAFLEAVAQGRGTTCGTNRACGWWQGVERQARGRAWAGR